MRANATKVPPEVQTAMLACSVTAEGGVYHLTLPKLPPPLYKRVAEALQRLGGKWSKKAQAVVFPDDPTDGIASLCDEGLVPKKNPMAFYATPIPVSDQMIEKALERFDPEFSGMILEPSAGTGGLADRARAAWPRALVVCVELDPRRVAVLNSKEHKVVECDFLEFAMRLGDNPLLYDLVLMNPPFTSESNPTYYIEHVRAAFDMLAPGGLLVSVIPAVLGQDRRNTKITNFEFWVDRFGGSEPLPDGSFKSEGTNVRCELVYLRKEYER